MGSDHARWLVIACAAAALAATRTDLYAPLPAGVPQALIVACFLALPLAFGLAVGRWSAALWALALVVLPNVRIDSFHLLVLAVEMLAVALLIATGVAIGRLLPRFRPLAIPLVIAGLLPLAVGAYRTAQPYDRTGSGRARHRHHEREPSRPDQAGRRNRRQPRTRRTALPVRSMHRHAVGGRVGGDPLLHPARRANRGPILRRSDPQRDRPTP